jgi:ABC-type multidrug transport system ATPase subunit
MPASIEAESLTKKFGDFVPDDSVSFSVSAGESPGLLGPRNRRERRRSCGC